MECDSNIEVDIDSIILYKIKLVHWRESSKTTWKICQDTNPAYKFSIDQIGLFIN